MRKAVAEAIGTFTIVFAGCGAIRIAALFPGSLDSATIPLVFGLAVAVMIYAVGHISGAHFNPAVTFAFAIARHFPAQEVLIYWAGQLIGAGAAVATMALLLPGVAGFGATVPQVPLLQAWGWEFMLSFFLMFVIIAVATDTRAVGTMAGAVIGATVMMNALIGGPLTGASMNPARSLAPALAEGQLTGLWIYLLAPTSGATLAALLYEWIRCEPSRDAHLNPQPAKGCC